MHQCTYRIYSDFNMSQEGGASEQPPHPEGGEGDESPPGEANPGEEQKEEGSTKVDEESALLPPSQTMAEPPGEGTQLPSATQEMQKRPPRPSAVKRRPKKEKEEEAEMPEPAEKDYQGAMMANIYQIDVDNLLWDTQCQYGQSRSLDESLAEHYFRVLKQDREITRPVRVLLWQKSQRM